MSYVCFTSLRVPVRCRTEVRWAGFMCFCSLVRNYCPIPAPSVLSAVLEVKACAVCAGVMTYMNVAEICLLWVWQRQATVCIRPLENSTYYIFSRLLLVCVFDVFTMVIICKASLSTGIKMAKFRVHVLYWWRFFPLCKAAMMSLKLVFYRLNCWTVELADEISVCAAGQKVI